MGLAEASDMVTDYLSAFQEEANQAGRMADVLAYAQANSNTTTQGLGEAFKNCAVNANGFGMDIEQTVGVLGKLADQGLKGSNAGTALSAVFRDMTSKMKNGAIQIGKTSVKIVDANGNFKDMSDIVRGITKATDGMSESQKMTALQTTFTADSIKAMGILTNVGADELAEFTNNLYESSGAASDMAATMNDNLNGQITQLKSALEGAAITIGEALMPNMKKTVEMINNAVTWFNNLSPAIQTTIVTIGSIVAAIGPILIIIGQMSIGVGALIKGFTLFTTFMKTQLITHLVSFYMFLTTSIIPALTTTAFSIGAVTVPVWAVIAAIGALIAIGVLLYQNWDTIKAKCSEVWNNICDKFQETKDKVKEYFQNMIDNAIEWATNLKDKAIQAGKDFVEGISTFFTELPGKVATWLSDTYNNITTWCSDTYNKFIEWCTSTINGIIEWFSELPYKLGYALGNALGTITKWGVDTWNYLVENVPKWIDAVVTFFSELPGKIQTWLTNTINNIISWGTNVYNKSVEIGTNFVNNIVTFFSQLPGKVSTWITNTYNNIVNWGTNVKNKAIEVGTQFINNIINFFSQLPGKIQTWLTNTIANVSTFVVQMGTKARDAATDFTNKLVNGVASIPGKMATAGRNIVEGLWKGISGAANWLKNKVSDFVNGIVDGFTNALKGGSKSSSSSKRSIEPMQMLTNENISPYETDYTKVRFNYSTAKQTTLSDTIASNYSMLQKIKDFSIDTKTIAKEAKSKIDSNNVNISLNIEKFVNETEKDIEQIAEELAFIIKRKTVF